MTDGAKINLSHKELELVCDSDWIFTKHNIIGKVYQLFGDASEYMQQAAGEVKGNLPVPIFQHHPKIYKGENYRLLPYVMLDYPRYFVKEETFAIRTLFWWGNFFSVTLHVSGSIKAAMDSGIVKAFSWLQAHNYWICVNDDQWEHHFGRDNYTLLENLSQPEFETNVRSKNFMKLAKKIPLQQWDAAAIFIEKSFEEMLMLAQSYQAPSL